MSTASFEFFSHSNQPITTIIIDLLDTPASRAWQFAVGLNSKHRNVFTRTAAYYSPVANSEIISKNTEQLFACLEKISSTEFAYTSKIPEQLDQQFFNQLHRHFTDSCSKIWCNTFKDDELRQEINPWLQQLNTSIHFLEQYVPTPQKIQWHNVGKELFVCANGSEISYDIMPFCHCHTYHHADLILDPHILGKTLIESFMCDDNPASWDTSGHVRTSGGACFILDDHRQRIYQSPEFYAWLNKHGIHPDQANADVPLGNFKSGHQQQLLDFIKSPESIKCYSLISLSI
jgi:hypothetical protein